MKSEAALVDALSPAADAQAGQAAGPGESAAGGREGTSPAGHCDPAGAMAMDDSP